MVTYLGLGGRLDEPAPWAGFSALGGATRSARAQLAPAPTSARDARHFVRTTLGEWHCDGLVDIVTLLVSELVTNAVLHARSTIELRLRQDRNAIRVEVGDASSVAPVLRRYESDAMTGRGLALVSELAQDWGVEDRPSGKSVWFVVQEHAS